jgi:hypothetical protein
MSSPKQRAASRANAPKSSGPHTTEGEATSRYDAARHGIIAVHQIMFDEKAEHLTELAAEYHEHHSPADPGQRFLVDTLVSNEWRIRRLRRVEAELWEHATNSFLAENIEAPACSSGDAFATAAPTFESLQRIANSCERAYHRALKELQLARGDALRTSHSETQPEAAPAQPPQPEQSKSTSAKMASFGQNPKTPAAAPQPPVVHPDARPPAGPFAPQNPPASHAKTSPRSSDRCPDPIEASDAALKAASRQK